MEQNVFLDEVELKRLMVQGRLLSEYEQPIYQKVIDGRKGLTLDLLVEQARKQFGNEVLSFYACDVATEDFAEKLQQIMQKENIPAFDIIHCSFMLMHTKEQEEILRRLKAFLAPGGKLIAIEPDDTTSYMNPDPDGIYREFLQVLSADPYAGKRNMGAELPGLFANSGYTDIELECSEIASSGNEITKKEHIFDTFCSYLQEDLILLRQGAEGGAYQKEWEWVQKNFEKLRQLMTGEASTVSMGVKIYTCG